VEEGRKPIALLEQESMERAQMEASEPGVFGKKKGPAPSKITGEAPTMVTVDEAKALTDQIRLEARAARDSKKIKMLKENHYPMLYLYWQREVLYL